MTTDANEAMASTPGAPDPPEAGEPLQDGDAAEAARLAYVERLASLLNHMGLARLPARVFAALLVDEDGRMTAAELAETLHVSPAAISGAVRYLIQVHWIHRERERGSRRDVFVVYEDMWQDFMMNNRQVYGPFMAVMAEGIDAVGGPETRAGARLALSVEFLDFLTQEWDAIAVRWEARRRARRSARTASGEVASGEAAGAVSTGAESGEVASGEVASGEAAGQLR